MTLPISEQLLTVRQAAALLPGRPHLSILYRWCFRGCRGVKLEYALLGGRLYVSKEKLQRFADRVTAAAAGGEALSSGADNAAVEVAGRMLAAEGL